ncbi:hypothetical protein EIL50_01365 [bacterium NHP-B]|nr:hypothetical protein EIL50_01365 [bacterium NHP-B]
MQDNIFPFCVGHETHLEMMKCFLRSPKDRGAFLVLGPQGVGKKTWVRQCVWEHIKATTDSQSWFQHAHQMHQGVLPSFFVAAGQTMKAVQLMHAHLRSVRVVPQAWQFVLMPRMDSLSYAAQSALLKIIEEPPSRTVFFLTAHTLGPLSAPLLSRCQKIHLRPLSEDVFLQTWPDVCRVHHVKMPDVDVKSLYRLSKGCLGKALALLEDDQIRHVVFYHALLKKGLLPPDHPDFESPFLPAHQGFWLSQELSWLFEHFEHFLSSLLIGVHTQDNTDASAQAIAGRLSPEGWALFLAQCRQAVEEAQTFHTSPLQVVPLFFRVSGVNALK